MIVQRKSYLALAVIAAALVLIVAIVPVTAASPTLQQLQEMVGEKLYFDETLSQPTGQSCASCHDPDFAFVDPDSELPVSEGVFPGKFGDRNSPSAAYAMFSPILHINEEGLYVGGQFWDGRATGYDLGDPLADQALGPFLNPVEMANTDKRFVVRDVANSAYRTLFEMAWPGTDLSNWSQMTDEEIASAYDQVALSIAAFERTELFAPFTSKYDAFLQACLELGGAPDKCAVGSGGKANKAAALVGYTDLEWEGLQLFMGQNNNDGRLTGNEGAMCSACHIAEWTADPGNVYVPNWAPDGLVPPMFTDFTFDNLGVPKNLAYPFAPDSPTDLGLGPIVGDPDENGKFKVMTLRNIGQTGPYAHNGFFLTLKEITHFYNTRDVAVWPAPEYPATVNFDELGDLGLSAHQEDALVAFMQTLDDGFLP
ncbi:MAG: cytochrome c peroxidase [Chloroflexota bacterium]|jgi:cytochrome c peroxidase